MNERVVSLLMKDATLFKVKIRLRRYSPCKNRSRINLISTCSILLFCKYKVVSDCSLTAANFCRLHTLVSSGRHVIRASSDHTYLFGAAYYVEVDAQQLDNCKLSSVRGKISEFSDQSSISSLQMVSTSGAAVVRIGTRANYTFEFVWCGAV